MFVTPTRPLLESSGFQRLIGEILSLCYYADGVETCVFEAGVEYKRIYTGWKSNFAWSTYRADLCTRAEPANVLLLLAPPPWA